MAVCMAAVFSHTVVAVNVVPHLKRQKNSKHRLLIQLLKHRRRRKNRKVRKQRIRMLHAEADALWWNLAEP
ncbi:hypothetical protein Ancab_019206 [Ancistrocladus abbreviatus]